MPTRRRRAAPGQLGGLLGRLHRGGGVAPGGRTRASSHRARLAPRRCPLVRYGSQGLLGQLERPHGVAPAQRHLAGPGRRLGQLEGEALAGQAAERLAEQHGGAVELARRPAPPRP